MASKPTFKVKNFDKLQHYKDRSPPWIKLYNGLLDDYEFAAIPDASKAHLLAIGLLASRYHNRIPLDAKWIASRINATEPVDLQLLIKSGFVIPNEGDSKLLAERYQVAIPEREGETEGEGETETNISETKSVSDLSNKPVKSNKKKRTKYPERFQAFWTAYPTDPIMSKKAALEQWSKLCPEDQTHAFNAVPGFISFCRKPENKTYRPVHAARFLSQRRFDGFENGHLDVTKKELLRLRELEADYDRKAATGEAV